ncbi:hypothetical protein TrLO_g15373 [Triparma laevis f. longispina]|uniref:BspA family leucine-rich repeat surface protein n=1 Tax=Triparma laevis f. longispina TaxID=1714387 RepID=A0A9W7CHY8_9STRA|nr:hypothetical protein TrLO_g15373 [Triparma laevis f. longispina]
MLCLFNANKYDEDFGPGEAAKRFNDDISRWNVDRVESMNSLFCECESFNQDLSGWNAEKCETMERMFAGAKSFNQDLTGWNVERVEDMAYMLIGAEEFDSDNIKNWDLGGRGGVFGYV